MVALSASLAAGCGGGSGDSTTTAKTDTQAAEPALPAAAFVTKIEKDSPAQTNFLCQTMRAKGKSAAFVSFKKGYALTFPAENKKVPPKKVFGLIVKHC